MTTFNRKFFFYSIDKMEVKACIGHNDLIPKLKYDFRHDICQKKVTHNTNLLYFFMKTSFDTALQLLNSYTNCKFFHKINKIKFGKCSKIN